VGIPGRVYASGTSNPGSAGYVIPALDFNEDGVDDFLGVAYNPWGDSTRVEAIDGKTAATLFSKDHDSYVIPVPARVGPSAVPGVMIVNLDLVAGNGAVVAAAYLLKTTISALDGTGTEVWTKEFHELYVEGFVAYIDTEHPSAIWTFDGLEGKATDILLRMSEEMYSPVTDDYKSKLVVLSGADGTTGYEIESTGDGYEYYFPGPDVDADGLEDLFKLGRGRKLTAHRGTNGEQLWEARVPSRWMEFFEPIGDVNGDGVSDIWTASYCHCDYDRSGVDAPTTGGTSQLLSGKNGRVIWSKDSRSLFRAGDLDGDGTSDFASQEYVRGPGSQIRYSAFSAQGKKIYEKTYGLRSGMSEYGSISMRPNIGDLDGDGSVDSFHSLKTIDFSTERFYSHKGVVSGADATLIRTSSPKEGLNASLDGHGDDLYDIKRGENEYTLSVFDGRDDSPLWDKTFPVEKKRTRVSMTSIKGPSGTDLLINMYARVQRLYRFATYLVDGRTGRIIWGRF
jgi:hypothetical protein